MKVKEIAEKLDLEVKAGAHTLDNEITGGYASDLLSDVLANSEAGNIWITLQIHHNTVAIASIKELSGIILVNNRQPEEETVSKAEEENIPIMVSSLPAFELIGRLYELGISGIRK
jgi:serine kinase of HPr protein (carbohydrate metabolism regulator)